MLERMEIKKLVAATKNAKKLAELQRMLEGLEVEVIGLDEFPDTTEVEETGETFEENAALKALSYSKQTFLPCVADDSGLEVIALGGAPGVKSARYAGPGASDNERRIKLLEAMKDVPDGKRDTRFRCRIALVIDGEIILTAQGEVKGRIIHEMRGNRGFGYDPVFVPEGFDRTFAEMEPDEKDGISHRGKALRIFRSKLEEMLGQKAQG